MEELKENLMFFVGYLLFFFLEFDIFSDFDLLRVDKKKKNVYRFDEENGF